MSRGQSDGSGDPSGLGTHETSFDTGQKGLINFWNRSSDGLIFGEIRFKNKRRMIYRLRGSRRMVYDKDSFIVSL